MQLSPLEGLQVIGQSVARVQTHFLAYAGEVVVINNRMAAGALFNRTEQPGHLECASATGAAVRREGAREDFSGRLRTLA